MDTNCSNNTKFSSYAYWRHRLDFSSKTCPPPKVNYHCLFEIYVSVPTLLSVALLLQILHSFFNGRLRSDGPSSYPFSFGLSLGLVSCHQHLAKCSDMRVLQCRGVSHLSFDTLEMSVLINEPDENEDRDADKASKQCKKSNQETFRTQGPPSKAHNKLKPVQENQTHNNGPISPYMSHTRESGPILDQAQFSSSSDKFQKLLKF
ncbi:hypothetical protein QQP08_019493 [Theobroma cacao]|nr:hypothetical protein QQP08_019493 [Theobroma cacao]